MYNRNKISGLIQALRIHIEKAVRLVYFLIVHYSSAMNMKYVFQHHDQNKLVIFFHVQIIPYSFLFKNPTTSFKVYVRYKKEEKLDKPPPDND